MPPPRFIARVAGVIVTICALVFVGSAISTHFAELREAFRVPAFVAAIAGCSVAYAVALQMVALGWYRLLRSVDGETLPPPQAFRIFARTQLYKYLPTNVLHLVGRFVAANRAGATKGSLAYAQAGELGLMAFTSATIAAIFAFPFLIATAETHGFGVRSIIIIYVAIGTCALGIAPLLAKRLLASGAGHRFTGPFEASACYVVFFIANGLLFVALAESLSDQVGDWSTLIGISAVGWLLGFVIPGAPGGLGVREAVFMAGLTATGVPASLSIAIALGHRLVTLSGDGLVALAEIISRQRVAAGR